MMDETGMMKLRYYLPILALTCSAPLLWFVFWGGQPATVDVGIGVPAARVGEPKMTARLTRLPVDGGPLDGVGLWRLDVDGQIFLMVVTRKGVGLAPYVPAGPAEGEADEE